jgi:hypothetical protein
MKTPAGSDCRYFYANYFRGRNQQECRLASANPASERWTPSVCSGCPVPGMLRANACPNLVLEGRIVKAWGGFKRKMVVSALCTKTYQDVARPEVGCGHCHEVLAELHPPAKP